MKNYNESTFGCLVLIGLAIVLGLICFIQSYNESKTYNKLTGADTTTWDALWVELRVQDTTVEHKK